MEENPNVVQQMEELIELAQRELAIGNWWEKVPGFYDSKPRFSTKYRLLLIDGKPTPK